MRMIHDMKDQVVAGGGAAPAYGYAACQLIDRDVAAKRALCLGLLGTSSPLHRLRGTCLLQRASGCTCKSCALSLIIKLSELCSEAHNTLCECASGRLA